MELQETVLDITTQKISNIEQELIVLYEQIDALNKRLDQQVVSIKETQKYLIKLAHTQQELSKKIISWPYIVISKQEED